MCNHDSKLSCTPQLHNQENNLISDTKTNASKSIQITVSSYFS